MEINSKAEEVRRLAGEIGAIELDRLQEETANLQTLIAEARRSRKVATGLSGPLKRTEQKGATRTSDGERRSEGRGATVFRPVLIETDDFAGFCLVRNISPHGMRAQVYTSFADQQPITVRFGSNMAVGGRLIWCDGEHIGVSFDRAVDVADVLATVSSKEVDGKQNRPLRLPIAATAELVIEGCVRPTQVQDISQRGLKVLASFAQPGEELTVRLQGLEQRKAVVRWSQGGTAGLNFIRPLSFDELAMWVVQRQLPGASNSTYDQAVPLAVVS